LFEQKNWFFSGKAFKYYYSHCWKLGVFHLNMNTKKTVQYEVKTPRKFSDWSREGFFRLANSAKIFLATAEIWSLRPKGGPALV